MSPEEFKEKFAEVIGQDPGAFELTTPLATLEGWDSVAYLGVTVMIEESLGVAIPPDALISAQTPADLLESALAQK